jgi:hypothetical protein
MISKEVGLRLHDLATRGKTLTPEEQVQLKQWYAAEDQAEMRMLAPALAQLQASPLNLPTFKSQQKPFPTTTLAEVAGCLKYQGEPKSLAEMEGAIEAGVRAHQNDFS